MKITVLSGGIGGAKFCYGLSKLMPAEELNIIVNTGDDTAFYGLYVSPDIDSVIYALAELEGEQGWGLKNDSFNCINELRRRGEDIWFNVGDGDMATHISRTKLLNQGFSLSQVTEALCLQLGVNVKVLPMSDQPVSTKIISNKKYFDFQEYMVKYKCNLPVDGIHFVGIDEAKPTPQVMECILTADYIILAPSNPFVSIEPILALPDFLDNLHRTTAKIIAISPIVKGRSIKGPAAQMFKDAGFQASSLEVWRRYKDFLDLFIADQQDTLLEPLFRSEGANVQFMDTLMSDNQQKVHFAGEVLKSILNWFPVISTRCGDKL